MIIFFIIQDEKIRTKKREYCRTVNLLKWLGEKEKQTNAQTNKK